MMKFISSATPRTTVRLISLVQLLLLFATCPIECFAPYSTDNCKAQKRIVLSSSSSSSLPSLLCSSAIKTTFHRRSPPLTSSHDQSRQPLSYSVGPKKSIQLWIAEDVSEDDASEKNNRIETEKDQNRFQQLKARLYPKEEEDGLTFRQKLAKAGLSVVLSYGWVSNLSYCVSVSIAWYIFTKSKQISPLAPGQWKPFLGVYAGFYVFNSFIRPFRFAISVGVSRYLDRVIAKIQNALKVNKGIAIFITVMLLNVVGTCALMFAGVSLASLASGVPIFPGKP